jgi:hypothetical protein
MENLTKMTGVQRSLICALFTATCLQPLQKKKLLYVTKTQLAFKKGKGFTIPKIVSYNRIGSTAGSTMYLYLLKM